MREIPDKNSQLKQTNLSVAGFHASEALIFGMVIGFVFLGLILLILRNTNIEWSWSYWGNSDGSFDRSAIFRNFGLFFLALIGLPIAIWRSLTAHLQRQNSIKQTEIAEKGLSIDRFQKGAQMLESESITVRVAGIYTLRELVISDLEEYYLQVLSLFYGHIREESQKRKIIHESKATDTGSKFEKIQNDLVEMLDSCGGIRKKANSEDFSWLENKWRPNLASANLSNFSGENHYLRNANLNEVNLDRSSLFNANFENCSIRNASICSAECGGARFSETDFRNSRIIDTSFWNADLRKVNLGRCELDEIDFTDAQITGANFSRAKIGSVDFSFADLTHASMRGLGFDKTRFSDTNISGVDFRNTDTSQAYGLENCWAWLDRPPKFDKSFPIPKIQCYDPGTDGINRINFEIENNKRRNSFASTETSPSDSFLVKK